MQIIKFLRLSLLINTNALIYYLSKLPLIGQTISNLFKRKPGLKASISIFGAAFGLFKAMLGVNILTLILFNSLPKFLLGNRLVDPKILLNDIALCYIAYVLIGLISGSGIFKTKKDDYIFLNHFGLDPKKHYFIKANRTLFVNSILVLPALYKIFGGVELPLILILIEFIGGILTDIFHLEIFSRRKKLLSKKFRMISSTLLYLGLGFAFYKRLIPEVNLGPATYYLLAAMIAYAFYIIYLKHYKNFTEIKNKFANADVTGITIGISIKPAGFNEDDTGLKLSSPSENKAFFDQNQHLKGNQYIEKAFRLRFKKLIHGIIKNQILSNTALAFLVIALIYLKVLELDRPWIEYTPVLITYFSAGGLASYFMSMSFRYMDRVFLYNRLWSKKDKQKLMINRTIQSFLMSLPNLIMLFVLIGLIGYVMKASLDLSTGLRLLITYSLVYYCYELYGIITYFGIMPFSAELEIKNPFYKFITIVWNLISFNFLFKRGNVLKLLPYVVALFLILVLAYILVYFNIDKRFRLWDK